MLNKIIKGKDNKIIIEFTFYDEFATNGLNNFNRVDIAVGGESYSTQSGEVAIESATELSLSIGTVTQLVEGYYDLTIVGINPTYPNGYVLNSECIRKLTPVFVCE